MICKQCGCKVPDGVGICRVCGSSEMGEKQVIPPMDMSFFRAADLTDEVVPVAMPVMERPGKKCPHCGKEIQADARFCTGCGTDMAAPVAVSAPIPVAAPVPEAVAEPTPEPVVVAPLPEIVVAPMPEATPAPGEGVPVCCSVCGKQLKPGDTFCSGCGSNVTAPGASVVSAAVLSEDTIAKKKVKKARKSGKKGLVIGIIAIMLVALIGAAAWFFLMGPGVDMLGQGKSDPDAETQATDPDAPGTGEPGPEAAYVDRWFIGGDLNADSLCIDEDGTWELRDYEDAEGNGGEIFCQGTYELGESGGLFLNETDGGEVAYVALEEGDALTMLPTSAYRDLFDSDEVVLCRKADSVRLEGQPVGGTFVGYWQYEDGGVLRIDETQWYRYDAVGELVGQGLFQMDEEEAWLMNEDGSSGGGRVTMEEDGRLNEYGEYLTRLDEFPFGGGEDQQ